MLGTCKSLQKSAVWLLLFFTLYKMTVKEFIEELKKYPEDTKIFIECRNDDFGITYIDEPGLDLKEEILYNIEEDGRKSYANYLRHDGIIKNALIIE